MKNIQVSLITTLFNESDNIERFLESYKNQTKYADEFIIVDGGSTDGTIEKIEDFSNNNKALNIKLIVDKTCSKKFVVGPIAKGRNVAIENTQYEYIAATDAGCVLDNKWFEEIIKPFEDNNVDVVSGWYEANIANDFQRDYAKIAMPKLASLDRDNFLPSSRSIAFKKNCWEKVGGYPTMTYTAEDTKYDLDLKRIGCQFIFTEKAFVYWDCPKILEDAKKKHFNYGYGDGRLKLFFIKFLLRSIFNLFERNSIKYEIIKSHQLGYLKGLLNA